MKRRKKKTVLIVILSIIGIFLVYILISLWVSVNFIVTRESSIDTGKNGTPFRAVVISDLHDHEFGKENEKLAEKNPSDRSGHYPDGWRHAECRVRKTRPYLWN